MNFVVLLVFSSFALTYGQLSAVQNVAVTPKVQAESTAVIFTWDEPATLGGNAASDLTYTVKACEINTDKCKESGKISEKRHEVTGLVKNFLYNYEIVAYGKDGAKGETVAQVFRTKARDTCAPNRFTCKQSPQCIDPARKCDGLINCKDGSDEGLDAGCTPPASKPASLLIEDVKEKSFVLKYNRVPAPDRATGYDIEVLNTATNEKLMKKDGHSNFGTPQRTLEITELAEGTEYKVRIRALNRAGAGLWSEYVTATTSGTSASSGVPSKVGNVKAVSKTQQESSAFILTWDAPSDLAGNTEADIKYMVKYCEINKADTCKETTLSADKRAEITGLKPNNFYTYHITAQGKDDEKGASHDQIYRTEASNSCAPNQYACKRSGECINPVRKCDGLINCKDGSDEDASAGCTPPSEKPSEVKIEDIKETSFVVKFKQVGAQDRAIEYDIEILNPTTNLKLNKKDTHSNFGAPIKSVPVTVLKGNTEYKVRVRAVNRAGAGLWSEYVAGKTTASTLKVQNVKSEPKPLKETTAFILTWDSPADLAGNAEADIKYIVKYCEINKKDTCKETLLSADKRVEITGLKVSTIYTYHITTFGKDNKKGSTFEQVYTTKSKTTCLPNQYTCKGSNQCILPERKCDGIINCKDGSDENADAGCAAPTQKPSNVAVEEVTSNSFVVKFKQVGAEDRATSYDIEILNTASNVKRIEKDTHSNFGAPVKAIKVIGLSGGTKYQVRVRVLNRIGAGLWSEYVTTTTTGETEQKGSVLKVGNVEQKPKVYAETTATTISWDTPTGLGESSESDLKYLVTYCEINNVVTCKNTTLSPSKQVDINGLKKNFLYNYKILTFGKDNAPGTPFESTFRTGRKRTCLPSQFACTASDGCVEPKKLCDNIVNCVDASDEGVDAKCSTPQLSATEISVNDVTAVSFVYKFRQVGLAERATEYEIEVYDTTTQATTQVRENHQNFGIIFKTKLITGLSPMRKYKIRVRANNRAGSGPWSEYEDVETKGTGEVNKVKATATKNTVRLTWDVPSDLNGADAGAFEYLVRYCRVKDGQKTECKETKTKQKSKTVDTLDSGSTYEYEVIAYTDGKPASTAFKSSFQTSGPASGGDGGDGGTTNNGLDDESGTSDAQMIGIIVGVILAVIILVIIIVACCKMRKAGKGGQSRQANGKQNGGYEMDRKA